MPNLDDVIKGLLRCQECNCDECCLDHASKAPWDCPAKDNLIDDAIEFLKEYRGAKPLIDEISNQVHDCAKMFRLSKNTWHKRRLPDEGS